MTIAEFQARTAGIAYHPRGAFFSELYLFVTLCLERGVRHVVESGVYGAVSTRVFRSIWPGAVTSIEFRPANIPADLDGVLIGDGRVLVPSEIARLSGERVGVFLDGPKGPAAAEIRDWCLTQPQVRVVALHDSPIGVGELRHSADPAFRRAIGDAVDQRIDPAIRALYGDICPGMGVWVAA